MSGRLPRSENKQHDELIASPAGADIGRPQHRGDPARHFGHDLIARLMTVAIVDVLESVYVDQQQSQPRVSGGRHLHSLEPVGKAAAVGDAGELVARGERLQLGGALFDHVFEHPHIVLH